MPRDIQTAFRDAVLGRVDPAAFAAAHLVDDGFDPARRLQVHRNNTLITLTEALGAVFPVVRRLVGDDFFAFAARRFIEGRPPASGTLIDYGAGFAAHLAGLDAAAGLPYLADVARLEWAWHESFHAADASPLDPARLAKVPQDRLPSIRLVAHPAVRLIDSAWPVGRIWTANADPARDPDPVSLDEGPNYLLVLRPLYDVRLRFLTHAEWVFIVNLSRQASVGGAWSAAIDVDSTFELSQALRDCLTSGVFHGVDLGGPFTE